MTRPDAHERPPRPDAEITAGWPDEPGNEELAALAGELKSARPALPAGAMERVGAALRRELDARSDRTRRWRWFIGAATAAAAAAMLSLGILLNSPGDVAPGLAPAEDRYAVRFAPPAGPTPHRALLCLDSYESLYTDAK